MSINADFDLEKRLTSALYSQAARFAVQPLFSGRIDSQKQAAKLMAAIRKRWVWLFNRLGDEGWTAADTPEKRVFMANCPPFGVVPPADPSLYQSLRTCNRYAVCPFCYARQYPINAYDRLVPLLDPKRSLVEATNTVTVDCKAYGGFAPAVDIVRRHIRSTARRDDVDRIRHRGAVVFHRVRVTAREQQVVRFDVRRATLAVVDSGRRVRGTSAPRTTTDISPGAGKKELAVAVGRAFAYPAEWYDQSTQTLTALMTAISRARVFAAYGECRRKKENDAEAQ